MAALSTDVRSLVDHLASDADHGKFVYLDPSDPVQRDAISHFLGLAGKDESRYPALHADVAACRVARPSEPLDHCRLVDAGRVAGSDEATARSWVASKGGALISGAHTLLLDTESGETLASGANSQVSSSLIQNATAVSNSAAASDNMTAVTFFHAQEDPDTPPRFGLAASRQVGSPQDITITVNEPCPKNSQATQVKIALWRDGGPADSDYIYPGWNSPPDPPDPDRLVVPFTGSTVLPWDINGTITPTSSLYVFNAPTPLIGVRAGFDLSTPVTVSGRTITWNFPFDNKIITSTASIQYEATQQANDNLSAFFFSFSVPVNTFPSPFVFNVCSSDWPEPFSGQCKKILPLCFWWHCIDADALVTLADGSHAPIRDVGSESRVRLPRGGGAQVEATTRAYHDDRGGRDPLLRLATERGRSLVLSSGHPVVATRGLVAAADLRPGDEIVVDDGHDRVVTCEPTSHEGVLLCNLKLADQGEGAHRADYGSFLANGIAVGDHTAQSDHYTATRHDPDYMLPRLPETHHQDYLSALADLVPR